MSFTTRTGSRSAANAGAATAHNTVSIASLLIRRLYGPLRRRAAALCYNVLHETRSRRPRVAAEPERVSRADCAGRNTAGHRSRPPGRDSGAAAQARVRARTLAPRRAPDPCG